MPDLAWTDTTRLRQILTNLLGNAIKFTHEGEVTLKVRSVVTQTSSLLYFEIQDSGIGIREGDQQKLFQPFAQADSSITRSFGGTGLGLVLSRKLAQELGGDLTLEESRPGQGSIFVASVEAGPFEIVVTTQEAAPVVIAPAPPTMQSCLKIYAF